MNLPDRLNRKSVVRVFNKVSGKTWVYLFRHDKENGLRQCSTESRNDKEICYSTQKIVMWLISQGYYLPQDFEEPVKRQKTNAFSIIITQFSRASFNP